MLLLGQHTKPMEHNYQVQPSKQTSAAVKVHEPPKQAIVYIFLCISAAGSCHRTISSDKPPCAAPDSVTNDAAFASKQMPQQPPTAAAASCSTPLAQPHHLRGPINLAQLSSRLSNMEACLAELAEQAASKAELQKTVACITVRASHSAAEQCSTCMHAAKSS